MSQVKIQKLATGGTFIIDGQEISGDNAINAVRSYLGETTGGIMDALREGQTVNYNSANNTVNITNSNGQSLTDSYLPAGTKANVTDSRFRKDWGATFHTKPDQFKRELAQLRGVNVGRFNNTEKPVDLKALTRGSGWFYTKDKDGNNQYIAGPENNNRMEIIKSIRGYLEGDDDFRKGYKTEGWKQADIDALRNWVNNPTVSNDSDSYWRGLFNRIQTEGGKNLTEADIQTLKLMGFSDASDDLDSTDTDNNSGNDSSGFAIDPNWKGNKDALKQRGLGIRKTGDGHWQLIGDDDNQFLTNNWWTAGLDFLPEDMQKGFLLNNGIWYNEDEVYNNPSFVSQVGGWYGARRDNWNDWYDDVNNAPIRFVNDRLWNNAGQDNYGVFHQVFDTQNEYNPYLSKYFRDLGINGSVNVADVTKQFLNLSNGSKVFAYLNPSSAFNTRGVPEISYVYYNPNSEIKYTDNLSGLVRNLYGSSGNIETSNYIDGKELSKGGWRKNNRRFALHSELNIPGSDNSVLADDEGNLYLGKWNESAKDIRGHRITNINLLNEILQNPNDPKWKNINLESLYNQSGSLMPPGFAGRKNGGTLPKFQFGGPIKNTNTTKTQKKTEESKTDIVKPHKLDGSDGKLDSWEKMQIAAAIGDAIGVGLSFGGVAGGVAGAATGVASTGTRFAADVKKDGLDWGDVKRGVVNLGFDLAALPASLIPGADNVIKGAKLVRTVKSIGQPVLKWLGTIGASTSTINIAKKWINGESPTSQDLSAFISGLGAGAVAGKQWSKQLGASRLASNRAGVAAKSQNANIPESVEAPIATGKTLKYKTNELSNLIKSNNGKQKPVIDKIIADAGQQGITLTERGAEEVLKTMGVNVGEKGKLNFWVRKDGKWVAPWGRGEDTVSFNPQQPIEGRSTLYYFSHPIARQRALGYLNGNSKQSNLLKDLSREEYSNIINQSSLRDHTIGGALRRAAINDPTQFNFKFKSRMPLVRIPWQFGWKGYVPTPLSSYQSPAIIDKSIPKLLPPGRTFLLPEGRVKIAGLLPQANPELPSLYSMGSFKLPPTFRPFFAPNGNVTLVRENLFSTNPTGISFNKLGGKIIKAQTGLRSRENWLQKNNVLSSGDLHTILNNEIAHPKNNTVNAYNSVTNSTTTYQGPSIKQNYLNNNLQYKADTGDQSRGGFWGNEWMLNKPNVDDAIRAAITARAIYHDRDLQRMALGKLYQRQFQTPQFDNVKYNYSDIEQGFNESAKPLRERKFVSSDLAYNLSDKHQTEQQLSELVGQKNALLTQRFNQTGDINRQINAQNETNRIQTANEKSQYLTNLNYQDAMLNSVIWNRLFSDVVNPFGQQMSQQGRDAWNKDLGMNYQFDAQNAQRVENARIQGDLNREFMSNWNALSDAEKKQYGDLETYVLTTNPERYKEIINGNPMYRSTMENIMRRYSRGIGAGMLYFKSGGNTVNIKNTNKNQRSAQEQIAINGHKAAKRSVDELSKALLDMLKQLQALK